MNAFFILLLTGGLGVLVHALLKQIPYVEMPYFVGCLFAGVIVRNAMEAGKKELYEEEMNTLEHMMLYLFISITLMTLDLTKLISVAGPMLVILISEVALAVLFGICVAYYAYGKNYNAAVMVAGLIGVGLGAAPNAVANEKIRNGRIRLGQHCLDPVPRSIYSDWKHLQSTVHIVLLSNLLQACKKGL